MSRTSNKLIDSSMFLEGQAVKPLWSLIPISLPQAELFLPQLPPYPYLSSILVSPSRQIQVIPRCLLLWYNRKQPDDHNAVTNELVNMIFNIALIFADF